MNEKRLITLKEFCAYLGIGATKGRELLRARNCPYSLRIGNRWYVDRKKLDSYLDSQ